MDPRDEQDMLWEALKELWPENAPTTTLDEDIKKLQVTRIREALHCFEFNMTHAANSLGIGRTNLIAKCKKLEKELSY